MDWVWTGCGLGVDWIWTGCELEVNDPGKTQRIDCCERKEMHLKAPRKWTDKVTISSMNTLTLHHVVTVHKKSGVNIGEVSVCQSVLPLVCG